MIAAFRKIANGLAVPAMVKRGLQCEQRLPCRGMTLAPPICSTVAASQSWNMARLAPCHSFTQEALRSA